MLPPGRAKLCTRPVITGSLIDPITTGVAPAALAAARVVPVQLVTITSTCADASSAAELRIRAPSSPP